MIRQIRLYLDMKQVDAPRNLAYLLYSSLCDVLPEELGNALHKGGIGPLSAHIAADTNGIYWLVCGFGHLGAEIVELLSRLPELHLVKLQRSIKLIKPEQTLILEEDDFKQYLVCPPVTQAYEIKFFSPTAFRSAGEYVNMPTSSLIIKSLVQRWQVAATKFNMDDTQAVEDIIGHCKITRYKLYSCSYPLKGVKIPAFCGVLTLYVRGSEALKRVVALLMSFANYSGIGIKTALGMGGVAT